MSRLRQKYKRLKAEYERLCHMTVPVKFVYAGRGIRKLAYSVIVPDYVFDDWNIISDGIDKDAAAEFARLALESGLIQRRIEDTTENGYKAKRVLYRMAVAQMDEWS